MFLLNDQRASDELMNEWVDLISNRRKRQLSYSR